MNSYRNGGPAFPVARDDVFPNTSEAGMPKPGMTLRDYFAAKAMPIVPVQTAYNMKDKESHAEYVARRSYEMADAMLKERDK